MQRIFQGTQTKNATHARIESILFLRNARNDRTDGKRRDISQSQGCFLLAKPTWTCLQHMHRTRTSSRAIAPSLHIRRVEPSVSSSHDPTRAHPYQTHGSVSEDWRQYYRSQYVSQCYCHTPQCYSQSLTGIGLFRVLEIELLYSREFRNISKLPAI